MPDILKKSPEPHQMVPGTSAFYGAHTPDNVCQRNRRLIIINRSVHQTSILIPYCYQPDCMLLYRRCSWLHLEKAEGKMMTAVRKKEKELTRNLKCTTVVLITDWC